MTETRKEIETTLHRKYGDAINDGFKPILWILGYGQLKQLILDIGEGGHSLYIGRNKETSLFKGYMNQEYMGLPIIVDYNEVWRLDLCITEM